MKKITALLMCLLLGLGLAACSDTNSDQEPSASDKKTQTQEPTAAPTQGSGESGEPSEPSVAAGKKILIVYYSATGSTEAVANDIAAMVGGDTLKLVPVDDYSGEDLNYRDSDSRVVYEHDHPEAREMELVQSTVENWEEYDTVFIGYPIWWQIAAWPVDAFVKANDFTGKTVIPFCTSASSGLGDSGRLLADMAGTGNWLEGQRFSSGASEETVRAWLEGLNLGE